MNSELSLPASRIPALPALFQGVPQGGRRFWEFFTVNIRNPNTRRAYLGYGNDSLQNGPFGFIGVMRSV
jgi:hypothetical protein